MLRWFYTAYFLFLTISNGLNVEAIVARMQERYRSAHTLQTTFLERYVENGHVVRMESGTAYFRRRGKMRWEYGAPEKNVFLVDGKTAWFYVPADHSVTRVPANESADWRTPLALLVDGMRLSRVCEQVVAADHERPENPEHAMLFCELHGAATKSSRRRTGAQPSQQPTNNQAVFLEVDRSNGDLVRVLIREPGGIEVEFSFANWRMDPPVPDSLFRFDPPKGVAIVNGELPLGKGAVNH